MKGTEQSSTDSTGPSTVPTIQTAKGRTEWANARRLVALHGQDIRYCPELGRWLRYDGRRWAVDRGPLVEALTNDVIKLVWQQVTDYARDPQNSAAGQMFQFARATSTLYADQWERLFAAAEDIKAFIAQQNGKLSRKQRG